MKILWPAAMVMSALSLLGQAPQAFALDGKALYTSKFCHTCHGADAKTPLPNYPKLAGQVEGYCVNQVKDIRDGKRTNGMTAAMKGLVATIKDPEIEAICKYVAGLKP